MHSYMIKRLLPMIPTLRIALIITIVAFLQPSLYNIMIAIGVTQWTGAARLVRGEFLKLRQIEFVEATRAMGSSDLRTIFPGLAVFITITAYNLIGEGMRDAIDPRLKDTQ